MTDVFVCRVAHPLNSLRATKCKKKCFFAAGWRLPSPWKCRMHRPGVERECAKDCKVSTAMYNLSKTRVGDLWLKLCDGKL